MDIIFAYDKTSGVILIEKKEILMKNGTFNKNYKKVTEEKFSEGGFYDPMDIVQVRYEMIKETERGGKTIDRISNAYGYSRASYYHIRDNFNKNGMSALIPERTGPKDASKLTGDLREFINEYIGRAPSASSSKIAKAIEQSKGVSVSKRTVERFRRKKKP